MEPEPDFSGYATKAGLKCSDGRTITSGAFKHQDKMQVPLVWQHGHNDPQNVLGHALLEARDDGMYTYAFFNESDRAAHARGLVQHKDINQLSIWANDLIERSGQVLHGVIREVSLVLSGANPGAFIDNVSIRHSDGEVEVVDDEVIIYTGLELEHSSDSETEDELVHEDGDNSDSGERTIKEIYDEMTDEQKDVLHYMLGQALASADTGSLQQSDIDTEEGKDMSKKTNVFESGTEEESTTTTTVLSHADVQGIVADATKCGSLKEAVENYALAHGIENIGILFPEAQALTTAPEWDKRRTEWVAGVLGGARKSPFSRIKTWTADLTYDEARAKGYVTGALKAEEYYSVARRITTPTTIYKKQKLDRDDIIDITDFDVVAWMKSEMRFMLDEEIARAILVGDGRDVADPDKINATNIRPVLTDDPYYTITVGVNLADASSSIQELLDRVVMTRQFYKGTGQPTMYTTEAIIAQILLLKDSLGRKIYSSLAEVASELRVSSIVPVEILNEYPTVACILVNMVDYVIGADRGGQVALFDDFDIDYNQYKYLIETRMSGALTIPKSAIVVQQVGATDAAVTPTAPTWDPETWTVTIPTVAGVSYFDGDGVELVDGSDHVLTAGEVMVVQAFPDATKYFTVGVTRWSFLRPSA